MRTITDIAEIISCISYDNLNLTSYGYLDIQSELEDSSFLQLNFITFSYSDTWESYIDFSQGTEDQIRLCDMMDLAF